MMIRAIDSLINSSFLSTGTDQALGYLFKDLQDRPAIKTPEDLLAQLEQANIGACVLVIMEPDHAEWVGKAHACDIPIRSFRP